LALGEVLEWNTVLVFHSGIRYGGGSSDAYIL